MGPLSLTSGPGVPRGPHPGNGEIADALERIADLLEAQGASVYRVRAYRTAARTARESPRSLAALVEAEGPAALEELPGIGTSIATVIAQHVRSGRIVLLERLEGQASPEDLFTTVPGIGEALARRIHEELGIETLEELELALHDGRLGRLRGLGERRLRGMRAALEAILGRASRRHGRELRWRETHDRAAGGEARPAPSVARILDVDAEYRRRAAAGELRRIAPRRMNPERRAWLPVLHTERNGWAFTALFSNTARAHELKATQDWVVVYYERDGIEGQCTVVTEKSGPRAGRRVVRGREGE
jgi:hypothetical protein